MSLRLLRGVAVCVALGGLFLLHLYAARSELPRVGIGDISPLMNFASVRIAGTLESDARKLRSGSVLYVINDGSGILPVFLNSISGVRLPRMGSRVVATGSLNVAAGNKIRMRAQSVEVEEWSTTPAGERCIITGRVSKVWNPPSGSRAPYKMVLENATGALEVVHWFEPEHQVVEGDRLEVRGTISSYKGVAQLKIQHAGDINPLMANRFMVSGIVPAMETQVVDVVGVLGAPRSIPRGVVYLLNDESGEIEVVFWDRKVSGEERDDLDEGVRVRVCAPVEIYKGKVQLVPQDLSGFQVLE